MSCLAQKTTIYTIGDSTMADKIKPNFEIVVPLGISASSAAVTMITPRTVV